MGTFVIFWSATFAIIFFILGMIFKALISAINALLSSIGVLAIGFVSVIVSVLLYVIIDGLNSAGFFVFIPIGVIGIFIIFLGKYIIQSYGTETHSLYYVFPSIIKFVFSTLDWLAMTCEKGYAKCLTAIIKKLDKC